ncbi:berberine bridge enzyme-like 21 [Senna tora]|uniref:Berberine bridge enzyme-like 21 n=1 Tax=Senna tora TaxID=362788 RepID=A0A834XDD5_9FABA|nr:berberine bridge enzyme-like 21 [Senna tora]
MFLGESEELVKILDNEFPLLANFLKRKSDYVETPISKSGLDWIWKKMMEVGKTGLVFNPYGKLFKVQYSVHWEEGGEEAERNYTSGIRRLYVYMTPFVTKNPRAYDDEEAAARACDLAALKYWGDAFVVVAFASDLELEVEVFGANHGGLESSEYE